MPSGHVECAKINSIRNDAGIPRYLCFPSGLHAIVKRCDFTSENIPDSDADETVFGKHVMNIGCRAERIGRIWKQRRGCKHRLLRPSERRNTGYLIAEIAAKNCPHKAHTISKRGV